MDVSVSLAGLFVGFLVGLTGVGGGSLMAPLLILLFGFSPAVAVGTDLWFATITKTVGGAMHRRVGSPDWQVIRRLALGSIPAAIVTLLWLGLAHGGELEAKILLQLLGAALILTAIVMPMKHQISAPLVRLASGLGAGTRRCQVGATITAGALVGCLVTLTSIGAGALVAVILMVLYPLRLDTKAIVGTDIVHAVPLALIAAVGHSWLGNVDWWLLVKLLIGSVPGIIFGSLAAGRVNEMLVRLTLAAMIAFSGLKLLLG